MQQCREHLVISSEMKLLSIVRDRILKIIRQGSFPPAYQNRLVLAVDEAVTNIIEHGYGSRPGGILISLRNWIRKKYLLSLPIAVGGSIRPLSKIPASWNY